MRDLLRETADLAADFLESLPDRPVFPRVEVDELRARLGGPVPEGPTDAREVVRELAAAGDAGAVAIAGGRYFGFVIGGAVPAALAADWLTSTWDQNAGLYVAGPAASVVEEVAGEWLAELHHTKNNDPGGNALRKFERVSKCLERRWRKIDRHQDAVNAFGLSFSGTPASLFVCADD